jgi:preprotein translocase subunit YajC
MAPTQSGSGGGGLTSMLVMFGAIFAIMYFLMIRPQQKRQKKHEAILQSLTKGDRIVTAGGIYGVVQGDKDKGTILIVKIAENVKIEIKRSAIAGKVEPE